MREIESIRTESGRLDVASIKSQMALWGSQFSDWLEAQRVSSTGGGAGRMTENNSLGIYRLRDLRNPRTGLAKPLNPNCPTFNMAIAPPS